ADAGTYAEVSLRAATVRSAVEVGSARPARLALSTGTRPTGETCLGLVDAKAGAQSLVERCTYGVVWPASVRVAPDGQALVVSVRPVATWRELWLFHRAQGGWAVDVVVPAGDPGLGYVEWAGWTPDGRRMLLARETRVAGRSARSFELMSRETLAIERRAERPADLTPFHRWQSPDWKAQTLALR